MRPQRWSPTQSDWCSHKKKRRDTHRAPRKYPCRGTPCEDASSGWHLQAKERSFRGHQPAGTLVWDLQPPEPCEKVNVCCPSHPVWGLWSRQPQAHQPAPLSRTNTSTSLDSRKLGDDLTEAPDLSVGLKISVLYRKGTCAPTCTRRPGLAPMTRFSVLRKEVL